MSTVNQPRQARRVLLSARPHGLPTDDCWTFDTVPLAELGDGEIRIAVRLLSLDPAMRGWMNEGRSYIAPVGLGEVMRAGGVGEVVASRHPDHPVGQWVSGSLGVQDVVTLKIGSREAAGLAPIDLSVAPAAKWLNPLGMPGMTAYFGLLDVGQPAAGETVLVSGAAGAVGQLVGQIARLKGCRVVGIAGGAAKCALARETFGFDECLDYRSGNLREALRSACPDGIDVYFDNVGGDILDLALGRLRRRARVVICGAISQYNRTDGIAGPANYLSLLVNRARMEGFVVFDYAARYPEAVAAIGGWLQGGQLVSREDEVDGLARFPEALRMLFSGANQGKLILRVG